MLSYGNFSIQSSILAQFKDAVIHGKTGQYFFYGLRRILQEGMKRPLMKASVEGEQMSEIEVLHTLVQNAALFIQNLA